MSDLQDALDQIKARAEKATEGPWGYYTPQGQGKDPIFGATPGDEVALVKRPADWRFIAHARADVPSLVAAVEAVLKVHKPEEGLHEHLECTHIHCRDLFQDQMPWPCPTVRALTDKLTGEDDD